MTHRENMILGAACSAALRAHAKTYADRLPAAVCLRLEMSADVIDVLSAPSLSPAVQHELEQLEATFELMRLADADTPVELDALRANYRNRIDALIAAVRAETGDTQ